MNVRTSRGGPVRTSSADAPARRIAAVSPLEDERHPAVLSTVTTSTSVPATLVGASSASAIAAFGLGAAPGGRTRGAVELEQVRAETGRPHKFDRLQGRGALDVEARA